MEPNLIFNTTKEVKELETARSRLNTYANPDGDFKHISDWVYETCKHNTNLVEAPKCEECKRRLNVLWRDQHESSADYWAEQLRGFGYTVLKPVRSDE